MANRGCGSRVAGGAYLTVPTGPGGAPIEWFLVCPTVPLETAGRFVNIQTDDGPRVITPRGIRLVTIGGVTHAVDIIGAEHYPNVADFIEEARALGISRRAELPSYEGLGPSSKLILIHSRAFIGAHADYADRIQEEALASAFDCRQPPFKKHVLEQAREACCNGLFYFDVEGAEDGLRALPCGSSYKALPPPAGIDPERTYAIFGVFPLGPIQIVRDPLDNTHEEKLQKALKSGLPVNLLDE